jgi:hypothetical protein
MRTLTTHGLIAACFLIATPALAQDANIRVLHLSPDTPAVDVYVNDAVPAAIQDLVFEQSTGYIPLPAATYNFKAAPANTSPSAAVIDIDLQLDPGVDYTAVAFDEFANIQPLALVDDSSGIAAGTIRYQIAHTAVGVGVVNIGSRDLGPAPIGNNVEFGQSLVVDAPAGAVEVTLDVGADGTADFRFDVPDLGDGILVNVFAATDAAGAPFLLAQLPDGSTARVDAEAVLPPRIRAVHLSPDTPNVDFIVGRLPATATDLMFGEASEYADVDVGRTRVGFGLAGAPVPAVSFDQKVLRDDTSYTVVAFDDLASLDFRIVEDLDQDVPATNTRMRIFHAADGVGQVDLYEETSGALLVGDLDFAAEAGLEIATSAVTIGLDATDDGISDYIFDVPALGGGAFVNVFAVTDAQGPFLWALFSDGSSARVDPR